MEPQRFRTRRSREGDRSFEARCLALVRRLETRSGKRLTVQFHRNRWTYFSCQSSRRGELRVRLHEAFLDAPRPVIEALGRLIRRDDREARRLVVSFVDAQSRVWDRHSDRPPRPLVLVTQGRVYDLQRLFDEINRKYFEGRCRARITWGRGVRTACQRNQITFGTYDESSRLIRVHPILDRRGVPGFFIRYIVYHEMLHAVLPATVSPQGRKIYHSRVFRQRERMYDDYVRAQQWGKRFVDEKI